VENIVSSVMQSTDDPTGGSTMLNHASIAPATPRGWHPAPFGSSMELYTALQTNFQRYAETDPGFHYYLWAYPDSWNLVLVTGNRGCIEEANWCGAP